MDFNFSWDDLSKNLQANMNGNTKQWEKDTRFWKLSKNEDGDGAALIRLLPDKDGKPMIKMFHYGIKKYNPSNPKKPLWFITNSPESIGAPCPVKDHYLTLTGEGTTEASEEAKKFKRQTKFVANIMVVKDPANPDNDGKVFLWEFGTKMKDKILAWLNPSDEEKAMGEVGKALYNPIEGNNIKLKIKKQGEFFTYDGTEVAGNTSALFESKDEAVKAIETNTYPLSEFLQPEFYEDYNVIKERFSKFLSGKLPEKGTKDEGITDTSSAGTSSVANTQKTDAPETSTDSQEDDAWMDDL